MEKLVLKFKASSVAEIEQAKGADIATISTDNRIDNLAYIISKAVVNEDGTVGCAKSKAMEKLDEYLGHNDTYELMLDIMEALQSGGFLPKAVKVDAMRSKISDAMEQANEQMTK